MRARAITFLPVFPWRVTNGRTILLKHQYPENDNIQIAGIFLATDVAIYYIIKEIYESAVQQRCGDKKRQGHRNVAAPPRPCKVQERGETNVPTAAAAQA